MFVQLKVKSVSSSPPTLSSELTCCRSDVDIRADVIGYCVLCNKAKRAPLPLTVLLLWIEQMVNSCCKSLLQQSLSKSLYSLRTTILGVILRHGEGIWRKHFPGVFQHLMAFWRCYPYQQNRGRPWLNPPIRQTALQSILNATNVSIHVTVFEIRVFLDIVYIQNTMWESFFV